MGQALTMNDLIELFPELAEVEDERLQTGIFDIWRDIAAEMPWDDLTQVPKNAKGESGRSLVEHVRGVTGMALAICEVAREVQGKPYDRDLLVAACLLHDVSKLVEYEPDPTAVWTGEGVRPGRPSRLGRNVQHAAYATHKIWEKSLPLELAHLVLTHTHASGMRGQTWEAAALFYADFADTDAALHAVNAPLYIQRWALGK